MTAIHVKDYGWDDTNKTPSHSYLEPALLELCDEYKTSKILDLGCGNGALCDTLEKAGYQVVGCDADMNGIRQARKLNAKLNFVCLSVDGDPGQLGACDFDAVISMEVIEHLYFPKQLPRFAAKTLKPGGYLIITTPYHGYAKNLALSLFNGWDKHHDPLWDGGHIKFWSQKTLTRLLIEEGFEPIAFRGVGRVPYLWKSMIVIARKKI